MLKRTLIAAVLLASGAAALPAVAQAQTAKAFEAVYAIKARGVTAGEFGFSVALQPSAYEATATRRTTGAVRALAGASQDYRYASRGGLGGPVGVTPSAYEHQGGRRNRLVRVAFPEGAAAVTTANPVMGMGDPPATEAQRTGVVDQVAALVAILTTPEGRDPCARTIPVLMDGRARFDFVMSANGRQNVRSEAYTGSTVRCRVEFRPLAGFSDPQEPATLTFLLAPIDGVYAPVRIQMPTDDVGVVTLDAKRISVAR